MDENEMQELDNELEADYEVGEITKDKITPYTVDWFTDKALEFEEEVDDAENAKNLNEPAQNPECKQQ